MIITSLLVLRMQFADSVRRSNQQDGGSEAWTSTFWRTTASRRSPTTSSCPGASPSISWTFVRGQKSGRQGDLGSSRGSAATNLSKVSCMSLVRLFAALAVHIRIWAPAIIIKLCQAQHVLDVPPHQWPAWHGARDSCPEGHGGGSHQMLQSRQRQHEDHVVRRGLGRCWPWIVRSAGA
jgi:hypothetical protein